MAAILVINVSETEKGLEVTYSIVSPESSTATERNHAKFIHNIARSTIEGMSTLIREQRSTEESEAK